MTDVTVTQSDIARANAFWTDQTRKIMGEVEGKTAASDDGPLEENTLVQAFARHRTNAVEELVEALEAIKSRCKQHPDDTLEDNKRDKRLAYQIAHKALASYRGEQL